MSCILRINELMKKFTVAEKKLAEYILANPQKISKCNAEVLATLSETSGATIIRFSKKLGYNGFSDFKISLAEDLAKQVSDEEIIYEAITKGDSIKSIIHKTGLGNIQAIQDTISILNEDSINEAVEVLSRANRIVIFAVGASGLVAQDLQHKLRRINKDVIHHIDIHSQLSLAVHLSKGDVALGISHSGRTLEVFKSLEKANQNGATTISITHFGTNPISSIADISVYTAGEEKNLRVGAIVSRIAQLTVVDILFIGVASKNLNEVTQYIKDTRKMVEDFRIK